MTKMTDKKRRQYKWDLFSIMFVATLDNFGFGIVLVMFAPLLFNPAYAIVSPEMSMGMRNILLSCLTAAFPLSQLFGASIFGDFADSVGRKKALILTLLGTLIGYALSALAIYAHSISFLIATRLFTGFFAGNISICLAALADMTPKDKFRGKKYGDLTVVYGFSWALSIIVGGFLSNPEILPFFNPSIPFWLTAFLSLLGLLVVHFFFTETHATKKFIHYDVIKELHKIIEALKIKQMRPYFTMILIWALGWGLAVQWFSAYSIQKFQVSQQSITLFFLIQGIFWSLGGAALNPLLLKKLSVQATALIGMALTTICVAIVRIYDAYLALAILIWIGSAASAIAMSNTLTLISLSAPDNIQGKAMGLGQSMIAIGFIIVPFLGGLLGKYNLNLVYPLCGLILMLGIWIIWVQLRKHN